MKLKPCVLIGLFILNACQNSTLQTTSTKTPAATGPDVPESSQGADFSLAYGVSVGASVSAAHLFTGTPVFYSISPALPTGLKFNRRTGAITGTPLTTWDQREFIVKAYTTAQPQTALLKLAAPGPARDSFVCSCQHTVRTTDTLFDGTVQNVLPGQKICLEGGVRSSQLTLRNITGTAANPVVIKNCLERVVVNTTDERGILIERSHYFRLTGLGTPFDEQGILVERTANTGRASGIEVTGMSDNYELDHIGVQGTSFGFYLRTAYDSGYQCESGYATWGGHQNLKLHHNTISDITGKGFFIDTGLQSGNATTISVNCPSPVTVPLDVLTNVEISENTTQRTGFNGIQVGAGSQIKIHDNTVLAHGLRYDEVMYEDHGINLQSGARGEVWANWVDTAGGKGTAFQAFTIGDLKVHDNFFLHSYSMFYVSDSSPVGAPGFLFANNTSVSMRGGSFMSINNLGTSAELLNNLHIDSPEVQTSNLGRKANNYYLPLASSSTVLNFSQMIFLPIQGSVLKGSGLNLSSYGLTTDSSGQARPTTGAWSVGALE